MRKLLLISGALVAISLGVLLYYWVQYLSAQRLWSRYESDSVALPIRIVDGFTCEEDIVVHTPEPRRVDISFNDQAPRANYTDRKSFPLDLTIEIERDGVSVYHAEYPPGHGIFGGASEHGVTFHPFWSKPGPYHVLVQGRRTAPALDAGEARQVIAPNRDAMAGPGFRRYLARSALRRPLWGAGICVFAFVCCFMLNHFHRKSPNQELEQTHSAE